MELIIKSPYIWGIKSNSIGTIGCFAYNEEYKELIYSFGINFIVGGYHEGKWTIPYILSHKSNIVSHRNPNNKNSYDIKIIHNIKNKMKYTFDCIKYNENKLDINQIFDISCYIGEKKYCERRKLSYYIKKGCKKSKLNFKEFIELSKENNLYYDNKLIALKREEELYYRSLIAISEGKKIICFPWIKDFKCINITNRIERLNDIAKKYECILLIPISNEII